MRRVAFLLILTLSLAACQQRSADERVAEADAQERAGQEKAVRAMVTQTEDQVRVKMLEQRVAALEAQVAAMQGDRKLLDAQLVEQRLADMEAAKATDTPGTDPKAATVANKGRPPAQAASGRAPNPAATPSARKPLVLDLR